jgi:hypothetical protein
MTQAKKTSGDGKHVDSDDAEVEQASFQDSRILQRSHESTIATAAERPVLSSLAHHLFIDPLRCRNFPYGHQLWYVWHSVRACAYLRSDMQKLGLGTVKDIPDKLNLLKHRDSHQQPSVAVSDQPAMQPIPTATQASTSQSLPTQSAPQGFNPMPIAHPSYPMQGPTPGLFPCKFLIQTSTQ